MGIITNVAVVFGLCLLCSHAANIRRIGSDLKPSDSGVDVNGVIFLLNEYVLTEGIIFAFSAYFRENTKVRLQIWRPVASNHTGSDVYLLLIAELVVKPTVTKQREDIYIESRLTEKCVRLTPDDRIGVYFEEAPSAVAYTFNSVSPSTLQSTLVNASIPAELGDVLPFSQLTFPYDFSITAYIDTELGAYANDTDNEGFVDCYPGLLIPDFEMVTQSTTTLPAITGAPGATGATGPMGPQGPIGETGPMGEQGENGTMGGTGELGPMGATGEMGNHGGSGATGPMGNMGWTGGEGPKGDQGDRGLMGPAGPPGPLSNGTNVYPSALPVADKSWMEESWMMLLFLIWLIVLTIVCIIIIIVMCCCCQCKDKKKDANSEKKDYQNNGYDNHVAMSSAAYDNKYNYSDIESANNDDLPPASPPPMKNGNGINSKRLSTLSALEGQPSWMNTMKSTSESVMSNNTIEEEGQQPRIEGELRINDVSVDVEENTDSNHNIGGDGAQPVGEGRTEF